MESQGKKKEKWKLECKNGLPLDEAISAVIKCTRRGEEYKATYFAYAIHVSGFGKYLWRRLHLLSVEDCGLVNPLTPVVVNSLRQMWEFNIKKVSEPTLGDFLFPLQAILFMCRVAKCREGDSLGNLIEEDYKAEKGPEIPEYAIDSHTSRGRKKYGAFGTGTKEENQKRVQMWFDEWSKVVPEAGKDNWEETLKRRWGYY
ncbi:MAG: hypothetical protein ACE5K3_00905 [bacterium]